MKKVILDSNIIFAALISPQSKVRKILSYESCKFYAPKFLFVEIFKYKELIVSKSKRSEEEVLELLNMILHYIDFIDERIISTSNYIKAFNLCKDVDEKDTPFVAFALEMEYLLWTRDEELKVELRRKGFDNFFNEDDLD